MIRPPVNLFLREVDLTLAEAARRGGFVSANGATIDRMLLRSLAVRPGHTLEDYADEFVTAFLGKTGNLTREIAYESSIELHVVLSIFSDGQRAPRKVYLAVVRRFQVVIAICFVTRPEEWE